MAEIIITIKLKAFILIELAIPADKNVTQQEAEEKLNTRIYVQRYNECGT
jgi:hypothetical protein